MRLQEYLDFNTDSFAMRENSLGKKQVFFIEDDTSFSSKLKYDVVLLGIPDNDNSKSFEGATQIKQQLYDLVPLSSALNILDLGNIKTGHSFRDTCFAIREVTAYFNQLNIIVVLAGGYSEFNLGCLLAFEKVNTPVNVVAVDSAISREKIPVLAISDLMTMKDTDISFLFNYINIGYQSYYVEKQLLNYMDDSFYESYRLGYVRANMKEMEPVLRDANILSFSLNSLKYSDAPGARYNSPNGFYGDEACQLAFYAGHSNRLRTFGMFDISVEKDIQNVTVKQSAQILWYFLEGLSNSIYEEPDATPENFTKFLIHLNDSNQNIAFYKSNLTNRWWMEITYPDQNRSMILSCSEADYELACRQDIPDRWLRTFQRFTQ